MIGNSDDRNQDGLSEIDVNIQIARDKLKSLMNFQDDEIREFKNCDKMTVETALIDLQA